MIIREFRERCLADSRLRQLWLDLMDATLESAAVRTRTAFARHGGRQPDETDVALLSLLSQRFENARDQLTAEAGKLGLAPDSPLTADTLLELSA